MQCQTLTRELQEALTKLVREREETRAIKRRAELSESELQDVKEQLSGLAQSCDMEQRQKSKYEVNLNRIQSGFLQCGGENINLLIPRILSLQFGF